MTIANRPRPQRGFTLIELLVVAALLVAVSFIAFSGYDGVVADAKEQVARAEMQEIAKAIRQFKQDTGYYPKQGPFGLDLAPFVGGIDPDDLPAQAGDSDAEREAWFYSPANFWQLFECPRVTENGHPQWLGCTGSAAQSWDPARGRGWRGPYVLSDSESLVDLSSDLAPDGSGDPVERGGTARLIEEVSGIADPFENNLIDAPGFDTHDGLLLDWRAVSRHCTPPPDPCEVILGGIGGPYFAFDLNNPATARLVSMGQDGRYADPNTADPCVPNGDDIVLCLE